MAWPTTTVGSLLSGDGIKTSGADMFNRDDITAASSWTWADGHSSMTDFSAHATISTGFFRMPAWAAENAVVTLTFTAYRTTGAVSGNCEFALRGRKGAAGWTTGGTLTTALEELPMTAPFEVSLTIAAAVGWEEEMVEFQLIGQRPNDGVSANWQAGPGHVMANFRMPPV